MKQRHLLIGRGNIIPRSTGQYPVYSSSTQNNGLFCYSNKYMFDQELVSWSIDGGGDFFYRDKHKFSLTNVTGYLISTNSDYLNPYYLYLILSYLHTQKIFDYQSKALPGEVRSQYKIPVPSIQEQMILINIFKQIDVIESESIRIINQLKLLKQGLLQQMFI